MKFFTENYQIKFHTLILFHPLKQDAKHYMIPSNIQNTISHIILIEKTHYITLLHSNHYVILAQYNTVEHFLSFLSAKKQKKNNIMF